MSVPGSPCSAASRCCLSACPSSSPRTTWSRADTRSRAVCSPRARAVRSPSDKRRLEDGFELSVVVEEYLPRLAARAGAPRWTGTLYAKGQSPFHAAVSRRYFDLLVSRARRVKVVVFGATGVVGTALLPRLASDHEVVAVSRSAREAEPAHPLGRGRCVRPPRTWREQSRARRSSTTSSTPSARGTSSARIGLPRRTSPTRASSAGVEPDRLSRWARRRQSHRLVPPPKPARDRGTPGFRSDPGHDAARRDGRRQGKRGVRDHRRPRRPSAGDDHARAGSRHRLSRSRSTTSPATSPASAGTRPRSAEASTSAGPR